MCAAHAGITDQDLREKGVRLPLLLDALAEDPSVERGVIFKGGSFLIKSCLEYPRFRSDLDFPWRAIPAWGALGRKEQGARREPAREEGDKPR